MHPDHPAGHPPAAPAVPTSIWTVAWASLAGQLLLLAERGGQVHSALSLVVSTGFGALAVGYVAAGVVRARTVRLGLAWVVLVLSAVLESAWLVGGGGADVVTLLMLATTAVSLAGLASFHRSDWFRWQRTRAPSAVRARIGGPVAVGVLVGVLGGLVGPPADGPGVTGRVRVDAPATGPRAPLAQSSDWIPASS